MIRPCGFLSDEEKENMPIAATTFSGECLDIVNRHS